MVVFLLFRNNGGFLGFAPALDHPSSVSAHLRDGFDRQLLPVRERRESSEVQGGGAKLLQLVGLGKDTIWQKLRHRPEIALARCGDKRGLLRFDRPVEDEPTSSAFACPRRPQKDDPPAGRDLFDFYHEFYEGRLYIQIVVEQLNANPPTATVSAFQNHINLRCKA
jgi:hypothetical protein